MMGYGCRTIFQTRQVYILKGYLFRISGDLSNLVGSDLWRSILCRYCFRLDLCRNHSSLI
jgi:hypothetical protein